LIQGVVAKGGETTATTNMWKIIEGKEIGFFLGSIKLVIFEVFLFLFFFYQFQEKSETKNFFFLIFDRIE